MKQDTDYRGAYQPINEAREGLRPLIPTWARALALVLLALTVALAIWGRVTMWIVVIVILAGLLYAVLDNACQRMIKAGEGREE